MTQQQTYPAQTVSQESSLRTGRPAGQAPGAALAPWWRRLLAFAIDALIIVLATGALWGRLIASFAGWLTNAQRPGPDGRPVPAHVAIARVSGQIAGPYLIVLGFTICVAVVYYWLLTGYWGTTIGKRALGSWVVRAADGGKVGLRSAFLRALVYVLGGAAVPLFLIDNLWLTADARLQCLHDKAARTVVVLAPPS